MAARVKQRRLTALGFAAILFAAVLAISLQNTDSKDALGLLYVVPVAIVGLELGLEAGLLAAALAVALVGLRLVVRQPEMDAVGMLTRAVAIFSVGALAGRFSDRMRIQAGLHTELEHARGRMSEQLRSAHRLLDHDEGKRREVAHQLHEQVAQTLAAAMMALSLIERDSAEGRLNQVEIESLRRHMRDCLDDLRNIANTLRPAVLVELGLVPALERLCAERAERAPIDLHADEGLANLPSGVEATIYRTVEEALQALDAPAAVMARRDERGKSVVITITSPSSAADGRGLNGALAATRARLELLGGTLELGREPQGDLALTAEIPVHEIAG